MEIGKDTVKYLLSVIDKGLVRGMGVAEPGHMCVMAAINYSLGAPHGDRPTCVHTVVRTFDISLNDCMWTNSLARAQGMRREAVAKLGSKHIDGARFVKELALGFARRMLPIAIRHYAGSSNKARFISPNRKEVALNLASGLENATHDNVMQLLDQLMADPMADDAYKYRDAYTWALQVENKGDQFYDEGRPFGTCEQITSTLTAIARNGTARSLVAALGGVDAVLGLAADIGCNALITCESEGSKFLYLCDLPLVE